METEDNYVAALESAEDLEGYGGGRVGGRGYSGNDANGLGDFDDVVFVLDDTNGLHTFHVVPDNGGTEVVLDNLVGVLAKPGFFNGIFGKLFFFSLYCLGDRFTDSVGLFLIEFFELFHCCFGFLHHFINFFSYHVCSS